MDLQEIMEQKVFAVVGDTLNEQKYAYQIKHELIGNGYIVYPVGKELASLNDVPGEIDIIDLCIHPAKGIHLLKENKKSVKGVLIQPGAESEEIIAYLQQEEIPYLEGCVLVGLDLYKS